MISASTYQHVLHCKPELLICLECCAMAREARTLLNCCGESGESPGTIAQARAEIRKGRLRAFVETGLMMHCPKWQEPVFAGGDS